MVYLKNKVWLIDNQTYNTHDQIWHLYEKIWIFNEKTFMWDVKYDLWAKRYQLCINQWAISSSYNLLLTLFLGAYEDAFNLQWEHLSHEWCGTPSWTKRKKTWVF